MTVDEIMREIIWICRKHDAREVILFGSRAKGTARERSFWVRFPGRDFLARIV